MTLLLTALLFGPGVDVYSLTDQGLLGDMNNTELFYLLEEAAPTIENTFQECRLVHHSLFIG